MFLTNKKRSELIKINFIKEQINKQEQIKKNIQFIKNQLLYNFKNIDDYVYGNNNNTVLLVEPRFEKNIVYLFANTYKQLGTNWNYVFYCGKSYTSEWKKILPNFIEIRPLEHDNFENTKLYSDFCKKRELWDSLYGDYVLTIQLDTWIMNKEPYNISYFINLKKSFIGGNMGYTWVYFDKMNIHHEIRNFNGGLSLRKRKDMITIIENFPPLETLDDQNDFLTEHEDVYFTSGCINLNLPIGHDENCSNFSLHTIYYENYFGIHQPNNEVIEKINNTSPYLKYLNNHLHL
jgi:hypothetical protein